MPLVPYLDIVREEQMMNNDERKINNGGSKPKMWIYKK